MKNNNQLTKDIQKAVSLFHEFGKRDFAIRANDPREGVYLARLARKVAKRHGSAYAYEWALDAYNKLVFERNEIRNIVHENSRSKLFADMNIFGAKTLVYLKEKTGTPIKQAYSL